MSKKTSNLEKEIKSIEDDILTLKSQNFINPLKKVKINSTIKKKEKELSKKKRQLQESNRMKYYVFGSGILLIVIFLICTIGAINEGDSYKDNDNSDNHYETIISDESNNENEVVDSDDSSILGYAIVPFIKSS